MISINADGGGKNINIIVDLNQAHNDEKKQPKKAHYSKNYTAHTNLIKRKVERGEGCRCRETEKGTHKTFTQVL